MQDTAYKHTGLTGCHRFRLQKLCQVGVFAKKLCKGNTFMSDWHIRDSSLFILNVYLCTLKLKSVNS